MAASGNPVAQHALEEVTAFAGLAPLDRQRAVCNPGEQPPGGVQRVTRVRALIGNRPDQRTVDGPGAQGQCIGAAFALRTLRECVQLFGPFARAGVSVQPLARRGSARVRRHQDEGEHVDEKLHPLPVEEIGVGVARWMRPKNAQGRGRLKREHARQDPGGGGEPATGGQVRVEAPARPRHQVETDARRADVVKTPRGEPLQDRSQLALRIDDQPGHAVAPRVGHRRDHREDGGDGLAGARLPEHQRVAGEYLARDCARGPIQLAPLGHRESGRARGLGRPSIARADPVDEMQGARKLRRDRELRLGESAVESGEGVAVPGAHRVVDGAPEHAGEIPYRPAPLRTPWRRDGGQQTRQCLAIGGIGLMRSIDARIAHGPVDEECDEAIVDPGQYALNLRRLVRGDFAGIADSGEMVEQPRPRLRHPLVSEREEHRGGTCGLRDHARSKMHTLRAPALDGVLDVVEGCGQPAGGRDDELDLAIEVPFDHRVDDVHEVDARIPGQLAGEGDRGVVMSMAVRECHWISSIFDRSPGQFPLAIGDFAMAYMAENVTKLNKLVNIYMAKST